MRIYTKTGDDGTTGLFGGSRIPKNDLRIESYGTIDELNSFIGRLLENEELNDHIEFFRSIQSELFTIGSHLATVEEKMREKLPSLSTKAIENFEKWMDNVDENLPKLRNFLLPGGHPSVADAHIARSVCRRAERNVSKLKEIYNFQDEILVYLNRLSDYMFVLARKFSKDLGVTEISWES